MSMKSQLTDEIRRAQAVKNACIQAAIDGYQDAAINGLCHEGAWEAAISAMTNLDIEELIHELGRARTDQRTGRD